jgi:hypothetical protein
MDSMVKQPKNPHFSPSKALAQSMLKSQRIKQKVEDTNDIFSNPQQTTPGVSSESDDSIVMVDPREINDSSRERTDYKHQSSKRDRLIPSELGIARKGQSMVSHHLRSVKTRSRESFNLLLNHLGSSPESIQLKEKKKELVKMLSEEQNDNHPLTDAKNYKPNFNTLNNSRLKISLNRSQDRLPGPTPKNQKLNLNSQNSPAKLWSREGSLQHEIPNPAITS